MTAPEVLLVQETNICGFCGRLAAFTYRCSVVRIAVIWMDKPDVVIEYGDRWHACLACSRCIERDDRMALLARACGGLRNMELAEVKARVKHIGEAVAAFWAMRDEERLAFTPSWCDEANPPQRPSRGRRRGQGAA